MWTLLLSKVNQPGVFIDRRQVDSGEIKIGRSAEKADWVIADPEGHLSRHHCTVTAIGLDLFVIDMSTNGVALNDPARRVAPQQPVAIRVRDRLLLGDYAIEVATEAAAVGIALQPPPAADPFASAPSGLAQPDAWFDGSVDPIWGVGAPTAEVHEFLGNAMHDFLGPGSGGAGYKPAADPWTGPMSDAFSKPILAAMTPVESAFAIPEDWAAPAPKGGGVPNPFGAGPSADPFGASAAHASDPFGADPSTAADPFSGLPSRGGDPFAIAAARDPVGSPAAIDPFAGFAPPGGSNPFVDPLHDPFAPSPSAGAAPFATPATRDPFGSSPPAPESDPFALPEAKADRDPFALPEAQLDSDPFATPPDTAPDPFRDTSATADPFGERLPPPSIDPFADYVPSETANSLPGTLPTTAPPEPTPAGPSHAAGWAAFCEGAGLTPEEMRGSPDAMRRLGTLYRQVVLGLSDLIQDRAAFKDEFRVERTQLSFGKNNPLKHLPALESAKLLLGDPLPGFMPADEAVRAAFEDIKKHQMAMLAGVQHALSAVFERLAPAEIERIMKKAAGERKGLPFSRGVNPWTVYQTVFDALRLDAASNVNSVMSVAFREGYETFLKSAK